MFFANPEPRKPNDDSMTMLSTEHISLEQVDLGSPGWDDFCFSFGRDIRALTDSIADHGVQNPIKLLDEADRIRVICGFGRIKTCQQLGLAQIPAQIYLSGNHDFLPWARMSLLDNVGQRSLNLIEKALLLNNASKRGNLTTQQVIDKLGKLADLPRKVEEAERLPLLLGFSTTIQERIADGSLGMAQLALVWNRPEEERNTLATLLYEKSLFNLNEAREFVKMLAHVAGMEGKACMQLLKEAERDTRPLGNPVSKKKHLLLWLKEKRYPTYSKMKKAFDSQSKRVCYSDQMRLTHAPFFESDMLNVCFKAGSAKELMHLLDDARKCPDEWEKLFAIMNTLEENTP